MTSKKNENIEKLKEEAAQIKNSKLSKVPKVESYSPVHPSKFLMEDEEKDFFKKSILYSLSSILKRWKKKEFVLNFFNNTLLIRKKGKEKLLYLINYSVKKLGKFKKKWCFSLINLKIHQRKYIVGCEDQEVLESWCKSIGDIGKNKILVCTNPHFNLIENKEEEEEEEENILMTNSHNDIGNLSKYDHFLSREDIMSPLKQANPSKIIFDTIPNLLLNQFVTLTETFEKKANLIPLKDDINDEEWILIYKEEYIEKRFQVFLHKNTSSRGKIIINFHDKTAQEIFSELKDPEYHNLWDTSLFSTEFRHYNSGKTIRINEIFKPMFNSNQYIEFEYLRYHGKLKNFCFIIAKSPNSEEDFEDKDPKFVFPHSNFNYAQIKNPKFKGKIVNNTMCLTTKGNSCTMVFDMNMIFSLDSEENKKIISEHLKNYRLMHKLMVPLYHFTEEVDISPNGRKRISKVEQKNFIEPKKINPIQSEHLLSQKNSKKYEFKKGNADSYATVENLKIFLDYFKSGQFVTECIINKHHNNFLPSTNIYVESNESQGHFAYKKEYVRGKNGGLHYLNIELMAEQKKVILSLLKQAGSNLIHGRSLMNVSLPLELFEKRSFLERLARSFGHAPIFLEKAGATNSVLEQMKYTISFFLSSIVLCIQQEKPFNPILGETFQGRINGFPIYLEQISHHPAVTYYLMKGKNYWFSGSHEAVANLGANTLIAEQRGMPFVHYYSNNTKIYFKWPMFAIHGTVVGTRYLNFFSKAICFEKKSNLLCEINFNINEIGGLGGIFQKKDSYNVDEIGGGIYKVKPEYIVKIMTAKKNHKSVLDQNNDILETFCKIKGEWTSHVDFDGKRYWDIEKDKPFLLEYEQYPLPSDCNYRDDVILMRMGNRPSSQLKKK